MPSLDVPGYIAGTWDIDPVHSDICSPSATWVFPRFGDNSNTFEGQIVTAENPLESSVDRQDRRINSVNTRNEQRDAHLRNEPTFGCRQYPKMTFTSTGIRRTATTSCSTAS